MEWIPQILIILCVIIIAKDLLITLLLTFNFRYQTGNSSDLLSSSNYPFVSILIAARNEQDNIERCIKSLLSQDYPEDKFEILVGDDGSEDNTLKILKELELRSKNLSVYRIEKLVQKKPGKMNVLAQLGEFAKGEYLLFTDADTSTPPSWIRNLTKELVQGNGIVTGSTLLEAKTQFSRLQCIEWGHAIGMMKVVNDLNINVTSLGNNMAMSREAYKAVGGYAGIPYSITEDYEIHRQICNRGFTSFHIFEKDILAYSLPLHSLWQVAIQRKRWMFGAFKLPLPMLSLLILNALYYPIILFLLFLDIETGLPIFIIGMIFQASFIYLAFRRLKEKVHLLDIILYEFYAAIINLWAFLLFLLPVSIQWKGRKY